ncbi:hypothetical protein VCCP1035_3332B, partial [Vibrio cholerae CP1035(8)]
CSTVFAFILRQMMNCG